MVDESVRRPLKRPRTSGQRRRFQYRARQEAGYGDTLSSSPNAPTMFPCGLIFVPKRFKKARFFDQNRSVFDGF